MFGDPWGVRVIRYGHVYADITWRQYVHTADTTKHSSSEFHIHSPLISHQHPWAPWSGVIVRRHQLCVRQVICKLLEIKNHEQMELLRV